MNNQNQPAFPHAYTYANGDIEFNIGLTKREYFAGKAMQGLLASHGSSRGQDYIAHWAVCNADALIAALAEKPEEGK